MVDTVGNKEYNNFDSLYPYLLSISHGPSTMLQAKVVKKNKIQLCPLRKKKDTNYYNTKHGVYNYRVIGDSVGMQKM